ncbi:hypothetical protein ACM66B_000671 [Microbotryomycetes sp. NB124-2]
MPASAVLYTSLALGILSLSCSMYTALCTLLPLLGTQHPLSRRQTGVAVGPFSPPPPAPTQPDLKLKSAQRFSTYLAIGDIAAVCVLIWDAGASVSRLGQLGSSKGGAARLAFICTVRTTLMMAVASISYINVARGTSISLGRADWLIWVPCSIALATGAALASLARNDSSRASLGIIAWLAISNVTTVLCFGRLLVAIVRVRSVTRQQELLPWSHERAVVPGRRSKWSAVVAFLPPIHATFSGLSSTFVRTIGLSKSSVQQPQSSQASQASVSFDMTREASYQAQIAGRRDMRSATPHSATGLLTSNRLRPTLTRSTDADSFLSRRHEMTSFDVTHHSNDHEILDFDTVSRPSIGSLASASKLATGPGGSRASRTSREEVLQEAWGCSPVPGTGTGRSTISVELSSSEARGAILRLGGHLLSSILGFSLLLPLLVRRARQLTGNNLPYAVLLVLGVCQHSFVLTLQCWASDGFWYSAKQQAKSTGTPSEQERAVSPETILERPASAMSTYYAYSKSNVTLPGIDPSGTDCSTGTKSSFGRALSMIQTHPKLMVLSDPNEQSASSSATAPRPQSHLRLRSLNLPKAVDAAFNAHAVSKSLDSTAVLASGPIDQGPLLRSIGYDEALVRALLDKMRRHENARRSPATESCHPSEPTDLSIDFLSASILPRLVPSVVIGPSTVVKPEPPSTKRPRSSTMNEISPPFGYPSHRAARNIRNLSLPILSVTKASTKGSTETRLSDQDLNSPLKDARANGRFETRLEQALQSTETIESEFDEQDDVDTSTIQCATVKPVTRNSLSSELDDVSSPRTARQNRVADRRRDSNGSTRSLEYLTRTNLTAPGFKNVLETGQWHAQETSLVNVSRRTSVDVLGRPASIRPLKLLSQVTVNPHSRPLNDQKGTPVLHQSTDENVQEMHHARLDTAPSTTTPEQVTSRTRVRQQRGVRAFAVQNAVDSQRASMMRGMR